jgi:hypothetical protein
MIVMAQRWATLEPLSEEATSALMRAFAQLGCYDLALRQFDRLRAELGTELGQSPCVHTSNLARAIVAARDARRQSDVAESITQLHEQTPACPLPHHTDDHTRAKAQLVRANVPLGRPLQSNDYVEVWWTVDAGSEDAALLSQAGMVMLRRHRLRRMIAEAHSQGALPTHADLAQALQVCVRTIARDLATMDTRGTRKSR